MLRTLIILIVILASAVTIDETPEAVAQRFFPSSLTEGDEKVRGPRGVPALAADRFEPAGSKDSLIVAAYSNAWGAAVRLLKRTGENWAVAGDWDISADAGGPGIQFVDLDGDKTPEVFVNFHSGGGQTTYSWPFRWDGNTLLSMGEHDSPDDTNPGTDLVIAGFVDLDGDGRLEIIDQKLEKIEQDDPELAFPFYVWHWTYVLRNGKLVLGERLDFYTSVPVTKKLPRTFTEEFELPAPEGKYILRVVKSGDHGRWHVKNAEIVLNGVVVAGSLHFRRAEPVLLIPVALQQKNTIEIRINAAEGLPGSSKPDEQDDQPSLVVTIAAAS